MTLLDRPLPHSTEAERSLLGAVLIDNAKLDEVGFLEPEAFYHTHFGDLWAAMQRLRDRGIEVDAITLRNEIGSRMADMGGTAAIASLMDGVPDLGNVKRYAQIVREKAGLRQLIRDALEVASAAQEASSPQEVESLTALLADRSAPRMDGTVSIQEMARRAVRRFEDRVAKGEWIIGIPTGIGPIDTATLGFQRQELAIIGARPSMGKTALALQTVKHAAKLGHKALFVQLDMGDEAIENRLLAHESGVPLWKIRTGQADDAEVDAVVQAAERMGKGGGDLHFSFSAHDVRAVVAKMHQMKRRMGLDFVIVDHIGHIGGNKRNTQRYLEVGEVSRELMMAARSTNSAVVAMAQLNRDAATGEPSLASLRESGNLEQDARVVLLLDRPWWREERVDKDGQPIPACRLNVVFAKGSEGAAGHKEVLHYHLKKQEITEQGKCADCSEGELYFD